MKLRIVFLNRSFYPDISATGQLLTELCEDLVNRFGCSVTVITGRTIATKDYSAKSFRGKIIIREIYKGIEVIRVKNTIFPPAFFIGRVFNYITYFLISIIATFRIKRPDLIVTFTDPPIVGLIGLGLGFRFNVPFIISVQDLFPEAAKGLRGSYNRAIIFLLDHLNRLCMNKADHLIVLGRAMQERLIKVKSVNKNKISIIPNWADCSKIAPLPKNNNFSLSSDLANYFIVMYAGNIGVSSGLEFMINTAHLLKGYKDVLFVFAGEGIVKKKLIEVANQLGLENVKFFPFQSPYGSKEKLSELLSSADIFVIPFRKGLTGYSVPSKTYPIMASGRPFIACVEKESELTEIIQQFNCGLLANPGDPLDLAEKILILYKNQELKIKMGENARKAAMFFDQNLEVKAYYELFERLHSAKKRF